MAKVVTRLGEFCIDYDNGLEVSIANSPHTLSSGRSAMTDPDRAVSNTVEIAIWNHEGTMSYTHTCPYLQRFKDGTGFVAGFVEPYRLSKIMDWVSKLVPFGEKGSYTIDGRTGTWLVEGRRM